MYPEYTKLAEGEGLTGLCPSSPVAWPTAPAHSARWFDSARFPREFHPFGALLKFSVHHLRSREDGVEPGGPHPS